MKAPESALAHKYLDGLKGIEIGGSAHNPFNIKECLNVDFTREKTSFTEEQLNMCGEVLNVDIVAPGDKLPFEDESLDFVLSAHSLEHFYDPIKAINEWLRVVKEGGFIFTIFPHKERTFDRDRPRTTFEELMDRFNSPPDLPQRSQDGHHTVWITEDALEFCKKMDLDVVEYQDFDDKVGNGFTFVIKKSASKTSILPRVLVFSLDLPTMACAQLRLRLPFARLKSDFDFVWMTGIHDVDIKLLESADLVIIQRFFPAANTDVLMECIYASGKPVVYELDDLLFDVPPENPHYNFTQARKHLFTNALSRVNAVVVTTNRLAEQVRQYANEAYVLHNLVDPDLFHGSVPAAKEFVTIGLAGSTTHDADFALLDEALEKVIEKYHGKVLLIFMGTLPKRWTDRVAVELHSFEPDYEVYASRISALGLDIALVPLLNNSFNQVKSNIKWLEYSACGIAGIYSNTEPYCSVRNHETGILVENSTEAWFDAICDLIDNPDKRMGLATAAQGEVLRDWNMQKHAKLYSEIYLKILREYPAKKDASKTIDPATWNEAEYLRCNPDVADAVKRGVFPSGLVHYVSYGRLENRVGVSDN
jgi:glycosyltransferase involved in cell wall biosynthesis